MKKIILLILIVFLITFLLIGNVLIASATTTDSTSLYYHLTWPWQSVWVFVDDMKEEDIDSIPNVNYSNVGDIYIGPSGAMYKLEPLSIEEQEALEDTGLVIIGSWEPISEENTP